MNDIYVHQETSRVNSLIFNFGTQPIRTAGTPEEPLFCAFDVCSVLDIQNVSQVCSKLDQDEQELIYIEHISGRKQAIFVTESGLYALILTSRKPEAKSFKRWVTSEVLPSIRKTGSYTKKPMTQMQWLAAQAQVMVEIEQRQLEHQRELEAIQQWKLEKETQEREALQKLYERPSATAEVVTGSPGERTIRLLNAWAKGHGGAYPQAWRELKTRVLHCPQTRMDLESQVRNAKLKAKGAKKPRYEDVIDSSGKGEEIYALAVEIFAKEASFDPLPEDFDFSMV
jgi:prophage antirepressor-like protein